MSRLHGYVVALVGLVALAAPARGDALDERLAGWLPEVAAGGEGPLELPEWARVADLRSRLVALAGAERGEVRRGAALALAVAGPPVAGDLVLSLRERAGAEVAGRALAALVEAAPPVWRDWALEALERLAGERAALLEFCRYVFSTHNALTLRLEAARRLGELGAGLAANHVKALARERERLLFPEQRRLDCVLAVALLRLGEGDARAHRDVLVETALSAEPELAGHALEGLRRVASEELALALRPALLHGADPARRVRAMHTAAFLGLSVRDVLEEVLANDDEPWLVRQAAAEVLGRLGGAEAAGALAAVLERREPGGGSVALRREAAAALGRLPETAVARRALERVLDDPEPALRRAALGALAAYGSPESASALATLLDRLPAASTAERLARVAAFRATGAADGEASRRLLASRLEDPSPRLALALVDYAQLLPDEAAVPHLLELLEHRASEVRAGAAGELRRRTGRSFGFRPEGGALERVEAARRWRRWWEERAR